MSNSYPLYSIPVDAVSWFAERYCLGHEQILQFERYGQLLLDAASNVTALQDPYDILYYHFADSLEGMYGWDMGLLTALVDVGSGGGFPGIPLAIKYPHLSIILLEVVGKKRHFLQNVIDTLGLTNVVVDGRDWRTFLRTADGVVDLFCARASLVPEELLRMYRPGSRYRTAHLLYWASEQWSPSAVETGYCQGMHTYTVGNRKRKLILFHDRLNS